MDAKKRARREALLVALIQPRPRRLFFYRVAAIDAPRTCFPPKTWTAVWSRFLCRIPLLRTARTLADHRNAVTNICDIRARLRSERRARSHRLGSVEPRPAPS